MNAFETLEKTFLRLPFSKLEQVLENYCDIARECMEEQGEEITDKAVREDAIIVKQGLTRKELANLIKKRPALWSRFSNWFKVLPN